MVAEPLFERGLETDSGESLEPIGGDLANVDYSLLEPRLRGALAGDPDAVSGLLAKLDELDHSSPAESIAIYQELALSSDPDIIDIVCNQLAHLMATEGIRAIYRWQGALTWHELLASPDRNDERSYLAQEIYFLSRSSLPAEIAVELDQDLWPEIPESTMPVVDPTRLAAERQRTAERLAEEGRVRRELTANRLSQYMKNLAKPESASPPGA